MLRYNFSTPPYISNYMLAAITLTRQRVLISATQQRASHDASALNCASDGAPISMNCGELSAKKMVR